MALKIIKRFFTINTLVQCFAGCAAKLADEFCAGGIALGAAYYPV